MSEEDQRLNEHRRKGMPFLPSIGLFILLLLLAATKPASSQQTPKQDPNCEHTCCLAQR